MTQSAVSQQIRALEQRVGTPLFHRRPREVALTDAGRRLLPEVADAIGRLTRTMEAFETEVRPVTLTVSCSVSIAQWYIVPGMARFLAACPGVRLRLVSAVWPDHFHGAVADVEIRFGAEALVGRDAERLGPDGLIAVCAPRLLGGAQTWEDVPLIDVVGTTDARRRWTELLGRHAPPAAAMTVDSHGLAVDLARGGAGIAMTSALVAAPGLADGSLVRALDAEAPAEDGYFLALRAPATPAAETFAACLKADIRAVATAAAP